MKVVILCGGKGMRMRGLTENIPKALADVNGKPIIWHIMKHYSEYGHKISFCLWAIKESR